MKIMAVFAHPDDEIGCIGTLRKHVLRGDTVLLVWTTLGELASQFGDAPHEEVVRVRREHGAWVAAQVGADFHFFEMGDSRMTGSREEALQLARLYAEFRPGAVITWSDDHPHPDHRRTAQIVFDALTLARIPKIINEGRAEQGQAPLTPLREPLRIYQYYAEASPYAEVLIDVSETVEVGEAVMRYYHDFYRWAWTPEAYRGARARIGELCGAQYAERFTLRANHPRALAYLD